MTQSDGLRNRQKQHAPKNKESQGQDITIKMVIEFVIRELSTKYPNYEFGYDKKKMLRTIEKIVNGENYTTSDKSYIIPDGGFLWVKINGKKYFILISEQKRQGTNDKRILEGKKPQSCGNAVERFPKNKKLFDLLFGNEKIYPVIAFFQGCDFFDKESTIGDRVRSFMDFLPQNQINLYWVKKTENTSVAGTYYMRGHSMHEAPGTSDWTFEEMSVPMFTIAETALNYYVEKYGK
jgi:type II restriction enzyme